MTLQSVSGIPLILSEKSAAYGNRSVTARYDGDTTILTLHAEANSFAEMQAERRKAKSAAEMEAALLGTGAPLANLGVTAFTVVELQADGGDCGAGRYVLGCLAGGGGAGTATATLGKLVAGYLPAEAMGDPEAHMFMEIAEEFLPMAGGCVLGGQLGAARGHALLPRPYDAVLPYAPASAPAFTLAEGNGAALPAMRTGPILMRDGAAEWLLPPHAQFYAIPATNNGQLLFKYTMKLEAGADLSLHHAEDTFNRQKNLLEVRFYPERILLLELSAGNQFTGDAFTYAGGRRRSWEQPLDLAGVFGPKRNGVCLHSRIAAGEAVLGG